MPSVYRPIERVIEHIGIRNGKLLAVYNGPEGNELRVYQANGGVFIVQVFKSDAGVDIFIPASRSLSLDTTLAKLDEYIAGTI